MCLSCLLSVHLVFVFPPSVRLSVCLCLSVPTGCCPCLSVSVCVCLCLSTSVHVSLFVSSVCVCGDLCSRRANQVNLWWRLVSILLSKSFTVLSWLCLSCVCVSLCVCLYVCLSVFLSVCLYVCLFVCVCVWKHLFFSFMFFLPLFCCFFFLKNKKINYDFLVFFANSCGNPHCVSEMAPRPRLRIFAGRGAGLSNLKNQSSLKKSD